MGDQPAAQQAAEGFLIGRGVDVIAFFQLEEVHAVRRAQAHHQVFALPLEGRHLLLVPQDVLAVDVRLDIAGKGEAPAVHKRVRPRPEAEVLGQVPVFHIVPRAEAWLGEIRDLVMLKPVFAQQLAHGEVGIRLRVVIRQGRILTPHPCRRLELEPVARQMSGPERQTLLDRIQKHLLRLAGQAVHQVEADVCKALCPREVDRVLRLLEGVDAPDLFQLLVVRGLHAERQAVHALLFHHVEHLFIRALRIALDRDLRVVRQRELAAHLLQDAAQILGPEAGRRAAADVDRVHRVAAACPAVFADVAQQRGDVAAHQVAVGDRIKIAVAALAHAERDVEIQPERPVPITKSAHFSSSSFSTAMNASVGICTVPSERIFFLPSFCFSSSFFLRVMSPP